MLFRSIGRFSFLDGVPELSGWAPVVAIVSGPSFAGHASLAGFSDFLISTPGSAIGMGGPPMVEASLGHRLKANELAGSEMHEGGGGTDLLVPADHDAIAAPRLLPPRLPRPTAPPRAEALSSPHPGGPPLTRPCPRPSRLFLVCFPPSS